ncbi:MAG: TraB/GumN family protein [Gammaproteobacteria bacterium]
MTAAKSFLTSVRVAPGLALGVWLTFGVALAWAGTPADEPVPPTSAATPVAPSETAPSNSPASASEQDAPLDEIEVVGERPGPQMWKVSRGDHVLWVLGTLQPLPKKMTWRSKPVEDVLAHTQKVLSGGIGVDADIGPITAVRLYFQWRRIQKNEDGQTLRQVLPAPLYTRFAALKEKYARRDGQIEKLQPMFAAASLYLKAVDASGLSSSNDIQQIVLKLARKRSVKVRKIQIEIDDPRGLLQAVGETPPEAQRVCLETTVARLEGDVEAMKARANAWSVGDVEALRALPFPDQEAACWEAVSNSPRIKELGERARNAWIAAAEEELAENQTTLALQRIERLLGPQGALTKLHAAGYAIEGPEYSER